MEPYRNLAGNSGIVAYENGDDFIRVQFTGGEVYLYTYDSAGNYTVERMKMLAENGKGLSTFISRMVKDGYAIKIR